jgi:hypothetical protein
MKDAGVAVSLGLVGFLRGRLLCFILIATGRLVRTTVHRGKFLFDLFCYAALPRVVSDVPTLAFELNRRRGKLFLKRAAAFAATLWRFVGRAHQYFEMRAAFLASIFVNWHTFAVESIIRERPGTASQAQVAQRNFCNFQRRSL